MMLSTNIEIDNQAIFDNFKRITNQIYKLLPNREENIDWQTPLKTIIEEISGMRRLLDSQQESLFSLLCKLEGLFDLTAEEDFFSYRRTIFESLNILQTIKENIQKEG